MVMAVMPAAMTLWLAFATGWALMQPVVSPWLLYVSVTMSLAAPLLAALLLAKPGTRTVPLLTVGTFLPLLSAILARLPIQVCLASPRPVSPHPLRWPVLL